MEVIPVLPENFPVFMEFDAVDQPPQTLGERVKKLRLRLGVSQTALSNRIGKKKSVISEIERGKTPTLPVLTTLASVFGVRVSFLIGDTSSDCGIETAVYQEALALFLRDHVVPETLEFRLRKLARNGAGSTKPGGWKHVVDEIAPGEQLIKRFPQIKSGGL